MECPRDMVEMKEITGRDDSALQLCETCGGVWIEGADLKGLLLHHNLPGLESMGGRANPDELADRCPRDQVDFLVIDSPDKGRLGYSFCEACGAIWLDLEMPEDADVGEVETAIVERFRQFRATASPRPARP